MAQIYHRNWAVPSGNPQEAGHLFTNTSSRLIIPSRLSSRSVGENCTTVQRAVRNCRKYRKVFCPTHSFVMSPPILKLVPNQLYAATVRLSLAILFNADLGSRTSFFRRTLGLNFTDCVHTLPNRGPLLPGPSVTAIRTCSFVCWT